MEQEWDYFARNSGKTVTDAHVVHAKLREARAAAKARRYDEALDGYIWFHENSANVPGLAGVRLSFALASWIELGRAYPPARTALEEIRDRKTKSLLNGIRDVPFFHDVVAINKYLVSERATYELFVTLHSSSPILARVYANLALPAIVNCGDFELARQVMSPPLEEIRRLAFFFQENRKCIDLQTCVRMYVNGLNQVLETLRDIGDAEQAGRVLASALDSFESAQDREAVRAAFDAAG